MRVGCATRLVGHNYFISNKCDFIGKTTDFQLVFNFEQTRTVTIFGEHGIMADIP